MLGWQLDHRPPGVTRETKRKGARGLGGEKGNGRKNLDLGSLFRY